MQNIQRFPLYSSFRPLFEYLPPQDAKAVLLAIFDLEESLAFGGDFQPPEFETRESAFIFESIRIVLVADFKRYPRGKKRLKHGGE